EVCVADDAELRDRGCFPPRRSSDLALLAREARAVPGVVPAGRVQELVELAVEVVDIGLRFLRRGLAEDLGAGTRRPMSTTSSARDRKSTRLNSSHLVSSYAVFCLKK